VRDAVASTGVSAGALIAPFAYLGPAYDDVVRRVATSIGFDYGYRLARTGTVWQKAPPGETQPAR